MLSFNKYPKFCAENVALVPHSPSLHLTRCKIHKSQFGLGYKYWCAASGVVFKTMERSTACHKGPFTSSLTLFSWNLNTPTPRNADNVSMHLRNA